jgi:hypothetical protein
MTKDLTQITELLIQKVLLKVAKKLQEADEYPASKIVLRINPSDL